MCDADQPGQDPRQPVLGGQAELRRRGGELGARGREPEVAEAGEGQADAGATAVHGGDDGQAQAPHPGHVVVQLGAHAVARVGHLGRQAPVVAATIGMAGQGVAVATHAERSPGARHDHDAGGAIGLELRP